MDGERAKDVASLPSLHQAEDGKCDRKEEHRPPAEDQGVPEEEEDDSRHPEEDDADDGEDEDAEFSATQGEEHCEAQARRGGGRGGRLEAGPSSQQPSRRSYSYLPESSSG